MDNVTSVQTGSLVEIFVESNPESVVLVLENEGNCHCTLEELNTAGVTDIQKMSLEEYNSLSEKVPTVLYLII